MPNTLDLSSIRQIYLSGDSERFVVSDSGDYYWWNTFNRSYQPIDISSILISISGSPIKEPGKIIGISGDNAGNLAFLAFLGEPVDGERTDSQASLSIWNSSTQSFVLQGQIFTPFPQLSATGTYSFALISANEFLLVYNGALYQFAPPEGEDWGGNNIAAIPLGFDFASTVVGLDGSAWALDNQGQAWIVDGTQLSLFNGSNNPPLKQLSVVDSSRIYGLGTDGKVYQWSIAASSFVDISRLLSNVPPILEKIQVDGQGILYGISSQSQAYQLFDTTSVVDVSDPNGQPFGLTTITDKNGITHAVWNEDGQIYYGYQQKNGNGEYIGVAPLSSGIGAPTQGSSTDLTLVKSGETIQAYWIDSDDNDNEVYASSLSSSPYGGYQWSNPQNVTNDDLEDSNLEVIALDNNRVFVTTRKQGVTRHQVIDTSQLISAPVSSATLPFKPKGHEFVYDLSTAPDNSESLDDSGLLGSSYEGNVFPPDFSITIKKEFKNKDPETGKTLTKYIISLALAGSVDNQGLVQKDGKTVYVPSNSFKLEFGFEDKGTLQSYITQKLNLNLQTSAKWPGVQPYPGLVTTAANANYELAVDTLPMILNTIAPGAGDALVALNKSKILELKLEALYIFDASAGVAHTNTSAEGDENYFFELVTKSLNPAKPGGFDAPDNGTPTSGLFWQFKPRNLEGGGFSELFSDPNASFSLSLGGGVQATAKIGAFTSYEKVGIKIKVKSVQTETLTRIGNSEGKYKAKTVFNYKWSLAVEALEILNIEYSSSNSIVEYEKTFSDSFAFLGGGESLGLLQPPSGETTTTEVTRANSSRRRVNIEPKSTAHLLALSALSAESAGLLAESAADLVDSADIAYAIQGDTAYGTFAGAVNDNSDNFTYLYFVQGTVTTVNDQTTIAWNPATLQTIPNTSGANQRPEIAIDSAGNVMITWQYESITNPTVAAIATTPPGQVYVVYGQGGNSPINLSSLAENPNSSGAGFYWTLDNEYFASLGQQVTALGDLNGAGKGDFAFTAPDLNDEQGGVYIVFSESYNQVNDLENLGTGGLFLAGQALSELGYSISNAGDVNGDGKPDVIIGAPGLNNDQGGAYLLYGGQLFTTPQSQTNIDALLQGNPSYGQQITNLNGQAGDRFGTSVTGGQDFNGDSKADYAIGAPNANQESGEITLVLSPSTQTFSLTLDQTGKLFLKNSLTQEILWVVGEEFAGKYPSYKATMQEDGNFVLYGVYPPPRNNPFPTPPTALWSTGTSGKTGAYLALASDGGLYIRGKDGANIHTIYQGSLPTDQNVSILSPNQSLSQGQSLTHSEEIGGTSLLTNNTNSVNGNTLFDIGNDIALIPDVNQDGKADLLIGGTGAAIILFGSSNFSANLDLATINPGQGFVLLDDTGNYLPLQVSSAGDVNGDGSNDVIIGHPAGQDAEGQPFTGNSYVLFGGSHLSTGANNTLGFSALNGSNGFTIVGAGTEVTGAGDINGDGVADLIVSESDAENQSGVSYVIYGGATNQIGTVASINVSQVGTTVNGYVIGQAGANQLSGSSVSPIGDINGDSKIDLLVGAPYTIPSADLTNLLNTITPNFITGRLNGSQVSFNNPTPVPIPNLAPGEALESLTATPFGILGIVVNGNNLLAGFWQAGTGWQGFQAIATLTDSNDIFTDIAVNAGNPVIVSWGATNGETSATIPAQSIYNGRGWNNTGFSPSSNQTPTGDIDNIIVQSNSAVLTNTHFGVSGGQALTDGILSDSATQFSVLDQRVNESDDKAVFTVARQGDTSQSVTLNYRTEDITATATSDYQHSEGTITFAPGETSKTIEITIHQDDHHEHLGEKFRLVLTPSSGSSPALLSTGTNSVITPLTATATITDANPTINLLAIDSGFEMVGPANALLTYAISSAGDVDGDGYGEFLISAPGDNSSQGKIYLIAGAQGIEVSNQGLNVDSLSSVQGLSITGVPNATTQAGYTLSNWGNYYALSAPNLSLGASGTSSIYVFQKTTLNQYFKKQTSVDITSLDRNPLTGNSANAFGKNVLLYDLNKDGTPELIVGSPLSNQVLIYTLSGNSKTLQATLSLAGTQSLGSALQVLDLDGDQNLDIAMGASTANPINDSAGNLAGYGGAVYVLKGTGSLPQNTSLSASNSWVFNGASNLTGKGEKVKLNPSTGEPSSNQQTSTPFYDRVGTALAVLDLNHDGRQDLVIGAPNAAVGSGYTATANLGKAYVLFGSQDPSTSLKNVIKNDLSQIGAGQGVTFQGVLASGQAGWDVANGKDINKDGIDDLLIGAPFAYGNAGSAYVAFGSTNAYTSASTVQLDPNIHHSRVFQYQGVANPLGGSNVFNPGSVGQSLGGVGDINGDYNLATGGNDIIIGAPSSNNGDNQGQIYAAIGHPWLQGGLSLNVNDLRSDNGFIELNPQAAVGVGDVNGDGFADFVNLGNPSSADKNNQLTLGGSTLTNLNQQRTYSLSSIASDIALITHGDFNADGYQDLATVHANSNEIVINYGGSIIQTNGQALAQAPANVRQITGGDVDGDGYQDLLILSYIVGVPGQVTFPGQVTIYRGSASGLNSQPTVNHLVNESSDGSAPLSFHTADFNGDATDEIFVYTTRDGKEVAGVWAYSKNPVPTLNPVSTGFDRQSIEPVDGLAADILRISSGDVNGDGYEDILVSSRAGAKNTKTLVDTVYYGSQNLSQLGPTSRKQFSSTKDNITPPGYSNSAKLSTFIGDVNADGFDDILINQFTSPLQSNIYLGSATGTLSVNVPIQGLPNRQTLYQTGQAGDINGDGYDDFLMADQDNQLTYAIYGQDWLPQTATWNSNATVQSMEGTNGNDVFQSNPTGNFLLSINGQNGDDYVNTPILPTAQTQLFLFKGGQGDDQFGLPGTDSAYITQIDGGSGYDTLFIQQSASSLNSFDLTKLYHKISIAITSGL